MRHFGYERFSVAGHDRGALVAFRTAVDHPDAAERAVGRRIRCPMLLLVSTGDDLDIHGDPAAIWRPWAAGELRSRPIHSGHHQAEQAPDGLTSALLEFLD